MERFLLFIVLQCVFCLSFSRANAAEVDLPARFVCVRELESLTADGIYALGGVNEDGDLVLLSSKMKSNGKLKGVTMGKMSGTTVEVADAACLWQLDAVSAHTFRLRPMGGDEFLGRKSSALGLLFSSGAESKNLWEVTSSGEGTFVFAEPGQTHRSLSVTKNLDGDDSYFDNYVRVSYKTYDLYVFELSSSESDGKGIAQMPAQGARVAIVSQDMMRLSTGGAAISDDALLCDGSLAPTASLQVWTVGVVGENTFTLNDGTGYLDYQLQMSSVASAWQIVDGNICTGETVPRYLRYDEALSAWQLKQSPSEGASAFFRAVCASPSKTTDSHGVCVLSGGWGATALAELDWSGVKCLDLSRLALPLHALPFVGEPETPNLPIFVNEEYAHYVPASWNFVVACGESDELLRTVILKDKNPVYTDRSFTIPAGMLTYERTGGLPQQWQTLCLPFDAKIVTGSAYALTGMEDEELAFEKTSELKAGVGYLVLANESGNLSVVSAGGVLQTQGYASGTFRGVFSPWKVSSADGSPYFLTSDGEVFRRAAAGSSLAPFRGFLQFSGAKTLRVKLK